MPMAGGAREGPSSETIRPCQVTRGGTRISSVVALSTGAIATVRSAPATARSRWQAGQWVGFPGRVAASNCRGEWARPTPPPPHSRSSSHSTWVAGSKGSRRPATKAVTASRLVNRRSSALIGYLHSRRGSSGASRKRGGRPLPGLGACVGTRSSLEIGQPDPTLLSRFRGLIGAIWCVFVASAVYLFVFHRETFQDQLQGRVPPPEVGSRQHTSWLDRIQTAAL